MIPMMQRVLAAFEVVSNGQTYKETLTNAAVLLAYITDTSERIAPDKPRRVSLKVASDKLNCAYVITIEEVMP